MSSREGILGRLRKTTARLPEVELPAPCDEELFEDYPRGEDLAAQFEQRLLDLRGELLRVSSEEDAARAIGELLAGAGNGPFLAQDDPLIGSVLQRLPDPGLAARIEGAEKLGADSASLAGYAAGITTADFLIARTGSIVLRSTTCGGRRLSVLPPLHIAVVPAERLVPSLDQAFAEIGEDASWSQAVIISGPSRTADIEKVLVLGAHGPRRLAVVLVG